MAACIFPGTRSALNFFGMSAVRCGMWRSPITRTSTYSKHGGVGNTRGGEGAARGVALVYHSDAQTKARPLGG